MSTAGQITRRTPITGVNNPAYQVSVDVANDSLIIASAAPDGSVLVKDSAQTDGWGFEALTASMLGLGLVENVALSTGNAGSATVLQTARLINGVSFNGSADVTIPAAAGTLTGATLAANVLASSLTSLGTLASLNLSAAAALFTRDALAAVSTDGLVLQNTTAATAGVPVQMAPRLRFRSHVWDTSPGESNTDDWWIESVPTTGGAPTALLRIGLSLNGAAVTFPFTLNSFGQLNLSGNLILAQFAAMQIANAGQLSGTGVTGQFNLRNNLVTAGVGFDVATDAIFKIRTRAHTGYATIDALGYRASGVDGVSFSGAVTNLTIVNGIVTAAS